MVVAAVAAAAAAAACSCCCVLHKLQAAATAYVLIEYCYMQLPSAAVAFAVCLTVAACTPM